MAETVTWTCCIDQSTRHSSGVLGRLGPQLSGSAAHQTRRYRCRITAAARRLRRTRRRQVRLAVDCSSSMRWRQERPWAVPGRSAMGSPWSSRRSTRSERTEELWVIAELLRVKGELLLLQGGSAAAATAEDHFRQALDWARRQGALVLGTARRHEPCPAAARSGPCRRRVGAPPAGLRPVHRGVRHRRPRGRKGSSRCPPIVGVIVPACHLRSTAKIAHWRGGASITTVQVMPELTSTPLGT